MGFMPVNSWWQGRCEVGMCTGYIRCICLFTELGNILTCFSGRKEECRCLFCCFFSSLTSIDIFLVAVMQNTKPRLIQVKCLSGTNTVPRVVHKTEDTASCFNPEQQLNSASPVICKLLEVILFEINNSYCWIENVFKEKNTLISAWKNCATEVF